MATPVTIENKVKTSKDEYVLDNICLICEVSFIPVKEVCQHNPVSLLKSQINKLLMVFKTSHFPKTISILFSNVAIL